VDWLAGTDPGWMRLRLAGQVVIAIGIALAVEWGFVAATGALQKPVPAGLSAAQVATLAAANHSVLVIAMLLGLGSFAANMDPDPGSQLVTFLLTAAGTYCRRFGSRGFMGGMLLFMGAFLGFFLQQLVGMSGIGWLAAEIGIGVAVTIGVHFGLFYRLLDPASGRGSDLELRAAARRLDLAYQALVATVWPLRTPLVGRLADRIAGFMQTATAARNYARNLILDASIRHDAFGPPIRAALGRARSQLADSVAAVTTALYPVRAGQTETDQATAGGDGRGVIASVDAGHYVRSASLFAHVADTMKERERTNRTRLALRDLQLLDGALAEAAR